jgi:hypothetical protein
MEAIPPAQIAAASKTSIWRRSNGCGDDNAVVSMMMHANELAGIVTTAAMDDRVVETETIEGGSAATNTIEDESHT